MTLYLLATLNENSWLEKDCLSMFPEHPRYFRILPSFVAASVGVDATIAVFVVDDAGFGVVHVGIRYLLCDGVCVVDVSISIDASISILGFGTITGDIVVAFVVVRNIIIIHISSMRHRMLVSWRLEPDI